MHNKTLRMFALEAASLHDHFLLIDIYFLPVLNKWPLCAKPAVVIEKNLVCVLQQIREINDKQMRRVIKWLHP